MKVMENKYLSISDLRQICVDNNWYTKGDNEEYSNMLAMAKTDLSKETIYRIAVDILDHTEWDNIFDDMTVTDVIEMIMFTIGEKIVLGYTIKEE